MNQNTTSEPALTTASSPQPQAAPDSTLRRIFIGPYGLRAGWRLGIFIVIWICLNFVARTMLRLLLGPGAIGPATALTPLFLGAAEGLNFVDACIAAWIMAKIEGRRFGEYGLPWNQALRKDMWVGALFGFMATSASLLAIFFLHGVQVSRGTIHGSAILTSAAAWTVTMLLVGLSEEFTFRGYPQFTLTTGMGFWPSAVLFSALFGAGHLGNSGENIFGALSVVLFGLLFCLFLRRRGNLWWAVGFHMGYDWGQTFFYGMPDSGLLPTGNLFRSTFSGPGWLTGGTVGPEASIFTPIALGIVAIVFSLIYRENRYRTIVPTPLRRATTSESPAAQ